jgi:predicted nuclease of predicted toxin-antitoxin system
MRFLLDENVSHRICPHLKAAGHDAVHVTEIGLTSADDQVVLGRARDQDRVLVSCDHDFVQLFSPREIPGPR